MDSNAISPLWAAGVSDKPLEWFYPNVFVRGELYGVQGIPDGVGRVCTLPTPSVLGYFASEYMTPHDSN